MATFGQLLARRKKPRAQANLRIGNGGSAKPRRERRVRPLARWDLAEDGVIVLQENNRGSTVETFRSMIEQSDLEILFTYRDYPTLTKESSFYFIGIGRRGAPRPNWA